MTLGGGQVKESADVSYISHSLTLPCLPPVSSQHTATNRGGFYRTHVYIFGSKALLKLNCCDFE